MCFAWETIEIESQRAGNRTSSCACQCAETYRPFFATGSTDEVAFFHVAQAIVHHYHEDVLAPFPVLSPNVEQLGRGAWRGILAKNEG
eukprot:scaffold1467_cov264-Pinguiococcus_pyrenoidosus.AAC.1